MLKNKKELYIGKGGEGGGTCMQHVIVTILQQKNKKYRTRGGGGGGEGEGGEGYLLWHPYRKTS